MFKVVIDQYFVTISRVSLEAGIIDPYNRIFLFQGFVKSVGPAVRIAKEKTFCSAATDGEYGVVAIEIGRRLWPPEAQRVFSVDGLFFDYGYVLIGKDHFPVAGKDD